MPRKSKGGDESPIVRRVSSRIAAVQSASPAKPSPKSPRKKRQHGSEDTESQQSQLKSETSLEEQNGVDSTSVKDGDSMTPIEESVTPVKDTEKITPADITEETTPVKCVEPIAAVSDGNKNTPPKIQESISPVKDSVIATKEVKTISPVKEAEEEVPIKRAKLDEPSDKTPATVAEPKADMLDFEVIDKNSVPAADSSEVLSAIKHQSEVEKAELPCTDEKTPSAEPKTSNRIDPQEPALSGDLPSDTAADHHTTHDVPTPKSNHNGQDIPLDHHNVEEPVLPESCQVKEHVTETVPMDVTPAAGDVSNNEQTLPIAMD